jgi:hypothetical protein
MTHSLIAFQGEVEVLSAQWDLQNGRTVTFRICGEPFGRTHPFKKYQQRRGGRVGSRFRAAFARTTTGEALGSFDLMLMAWKDSSTAGQQVSFWIDDEPTAHPFCGCAYRRNGTPGDVFALVLVELDDEDKPIDQERRDRLDGPGAAPPSGLHDGQATGGAPPPAAQTGDRASAALPGSHAPTGKRAARGTGAPRKLSSSAHLLVSSPLFVRYLAETKPTLVKEWSGDKARVYAKKLIKVESLSDLDRDPEAVRRFHELIRKPYDRWYRQEP